MRALKYFNFFLGLIGLFFLNSCSSYCYRSYPYRVCQTDLCENVQQAFQTEAVTIGDFGEKPWWSFFQDPQLCWLIELSLNCNPSIKIAEARIQLACQEARIARAALYPHLYAFGNVERERVSIFGTEFIPGLPRIFTETTIGLTSANYELDIWKKNRSLYYSALDEMQASIADYEEANLLISTTLAMVYFELQMNLAQLKVTRDRLVAREELNALLKQQFDLGIISEYRLYETDTEVQLLKDLIFQLEGEIAINQHAITALVGNNSCLCGNGELQLAPSAIFDTPFPLPATLPIDLLARRPDITAAKWHVEASCFDIQAAKANFFPRIDLLGLIGVQSIFIEKLLRGDAILGIGNVLGTLPLYLAGKLQAELGVARETLEIAVESYNQTVLDAVQQVSDALTRLVTADERDHSLFAAIHDAEELYNLTEQKYQNGIANKIAVLNSIENVLSLKELEVSIQLDRFQAAVELIRSIGGGYYDSDCI